MSAPIRVMVVDDQGVIRAGLKMIIDHEPDMSVTAEAADGEQAIRLAEQLRPDVLLMDIRMPVLDGIAATRQITALPGGQAMSVLVLTTFDDEEYVLGAVRAGAAGFLLKDAGPDLLVSAVRAIHGGDTLVDPAVTRTLITRCLDLEAEAMAHAALHGHTPPKVSLPGRWDKQLATLSEREREILIGMARGLSNRDLANELVLSETTIKSHVSAVLTKLGLRSRVQAVVLAYEAGVVRPGQAELA